MNTETPGPGAAPANPFGERREQTFPTLTPAQIARLIPHGKRIAVHKGQILAEPGDRHRNLFVVLSGSIEIVRVTMQGEQLLVVTEPGGFTGEMSTLRGVGSLVRARVRADGEVLAIPDDQLRTVVQTDARLSELFMRAFILRRVALVATQQGDVVLIGSRHSAGTLRVQQFLSRNAFPFVNLDVDTDPSVQALLDRFHVTTEDIPIVICRGETMAKNPSNEELAECLGMNPQIDCKTIRDVIVIGAGPAGLAAAVYAASEGLNVLVLETNAPGGQAGSSSRIENYLGFPTGISGQALAGRALVQAQKFGAEVAIANSVTRLRCAPQPFEIELSGDHRVRGRAIIVASGVEYRKLALSNIDSFLGVGIYYAATYIEAQLCKDEDIVIVGGGNSAGQAAVFLASNCKHVHLLVRSNGLADSMSRYLVRRIDDTPNITLRTCTEITALQGDTRLEEVTWHCTLDNRTETRPIRHVFLMTGAVPNTRWLEGCLGLDEKGFVRTGTELHAEEIAAGRWPLPRQPYMFETTVPRIFAVGDVRCGSVKRVAAAVGEGSACVQLVHRVLAE
ncbi:MAG TPA: FAD-dependent oxidoreductase [Steroidobacteraceae bacterium]|nr:FAD-dependent oxidoreductase [Steroidobacteraceae bacterium]